MRRQRGVTYASHAQRPASCHPSSNPVIVLHLNCVRRADRCHWHIFAVFDQGNRSSGRTPRVGNLVAKVVVKPLDESMVLSRRLQSFCCVSNSLITSEIAGMNGLDFRNARQVDSSSTKRGASAITSSNSMRTKISGSGIFDVGKVAHQDGNHFSYFAIDGAIALFGPPTFGIAPNPEFLQAADEARPPIASK